MTTQSDGLALSGKIITSENGKSTVNSDNENISEKDASAASGKGSAVKNRNDNICNQNAVQDDDEDDQMMDIEVPSGMVFLEDSAGDDGRINLIQQKHHTKNLPQKPAVNLQVDDRAILDCWNLTVASHEAAMVVTATNPTNTSASFDSSPSTTTTSLTSPFVTLLENEYRWNAKDKASTAPDATDVFGSWEPKPLALPIWAIVP